MFAVIYTDTNEYMTRLINTKNNGRSLNKLEAHVFSSYARALAMVGRYIIKEEDDPERYAILEKSPQTKPCGHANKYWEELGKPRVDYTDKYLAHLAKGGRWLDYKGKIYNKRLPKNMRIVEI